LLPGVGKYICRAKKPKYAKNISKNEVLDTYAYKHIIKGKTLDLYYAYNISSKFLLAHP
jgi:hypothetical protein